jgi:hypothetical protein
MRGRLSTLSTFTARESIQDRVTRSRIHTILYGYLHLCKHAESPTNKNGTHRPQKADKQTGWYVLLIDLAWASRALSMSSFTQLARSKIACSATIRRTDSTGMGWIAAVRALLLLLLPLVADAAAAAVAVKEGDALMLLFERRRPVRAENWVLASKTHTKQVSTTTQPIDQSNHSSHNSSNLSVSRERCYSSVSISVSTLLELEDIYLGLIASCPCPLSPAVLLKSLLLFALACAGCSPI